VCAFRVLAKRCDHAALAQLCRTVGHAQAALQSLAVISDA
jgi:hypothetical protein